jgi:hypothetical protein
VQTTIVHKVRSKLVKKQNTQNPVTNWYYTEARVNTGQFSIKNNGTKYKKLYKRVQTTKGPTKSGTIWYKTLYFVQEHCIYYFLVESKQNI